LSRLPFEVLVLVRRRDEILVLHRSPRQGAYWHSVAGAVEEGESWADAAARELLEETGLVAEPVEIGTPYAYALEEFPEYRASVPAGAVEIVVHAFLVDAPTDWEPVIDWEHDAYRWCARDEAIELLHWPEPKELLKNL
jgi:8-oxo-dGTP pyrophosphatase MutT (NUDIX family)